MKNNCTIIKFADHTALIGKIKDNEDFKNYQTQLNHIANWSNENELQLNATKTKELVFDFRRKSSMFGKDTLITLNGIKIEPSKSAKYLGVEISCNLNWDNHVEYVIGKTISKMYFLKKLGSYSMSERFYIRVMRV